ncbi:MAG: WGR domain-containing protein [Armatimonadota bacterium]
MTETSMLSDAEQIYHCTTDDAHKFWKIQVTGNVQTVCYGRIGAEGHTQSKTYETPEEAQAATSRIIAQKLAKGYYRVTETEAAATRPKRPIRRSAEQLLLSFEEMPTLTTPPVKETPAEPASLTLF